MKKRLDALLESVLSEDSLPSPPTNSSQVTEPVTDIDVSLDAVIDRYIVRYEKESIPTAQTYENELFADQQYVEPSPMGESKNALNKTLSYVLKEAPGDEEDEEGLDLDEPAEEEPAEEPAIDTSDSPDAVTSQQQPPKAVMQTPQINLNDFARSMARLVNNYDTLINPKEVILNRLRKYVEMNYDVRTAKELMDILDMNYSLRTNERENESEEEWPTPYAAGALSTEG